MSYNPLVIANKIIELKNYNLTIMELLKLQYIAHGYTLAILEKPLFESKIEAWPYGPVICEVYNVFKSAQGIHIKDPVSVEVNKDIDEACCGILKAVVENYGNKNGWELSALTHEENSPWTQIVSERGFYAEIPNDLTKSYYKNLIS